MTHAPAGRRLAVSFFPGAGSAHILLAARDDIFTSAGLDVQLMEVTSSTEQMLAWDDGRTDVMHTSPDHLLRERRHDPVAIRREGIGDLTLYARPGSVEEPLARWAVDGEDSAFALVLRAMLDHLGVQWTQDQLRRVGGTKQRWQALQAGDVDGCVLHPPFSGLAEQAGFVPEVGHGQVLPDLTTVVAVCARDAAGSTDVVDYVACIDEARRQIVAGGPTLISSVLQAHGWPADMADTAGFDMLGARGLGTESNLYEDSLRSVIELRRRYLPSWEPPRDLATLVHTG